MDGGRQFLFRRDEVANVDTMPLKQFVRGKEPVPDRDGNAVTRLISAIGAAVSRILGCQLMWVSNRRFRDYPVDLPPEDSQRYR